MTTSIRHAAQAHRAAARTAARTAGSLLAAHRTVALWTGALAIGSGALLVPGTAVAQPAQTVRPTTPGSSVFTAPEQDERHATVEVAHPAAYELPHSASPQAAVSIADNLALTPAKTEDGAATEAHEHAPAADRSAERSEAPAPAPAPAPQPEPEPAPAPAPSWYSPAPGAKISNPYGGKNAGYAAGYHTGTDFAVSTGTPLLAVADATVVSAGRGGAYGNEVVLRLPDGKFAEYAHLSSIGVKAGQTVKAGQQIGKSGSTGNSTGPHLHFEIRSVNRYAAVIDPLGYLKAHGAVGF
ncbi:peptidoglycan DD-metalloendopeptidase family protein [Kitasatospora sp. NPDC096147]|uniref:M23 family metallopeptidase n=1 Tax=Kitasatospora sp. NPDC096147 TaxID=3364093 RepID=UPI0037F26956